MIALRKYLTQETGSWIPTTIRGRPSTSEVQQRVLHMEREQRAVSLFLSRVSVIACSTATALIESHSLGTVVVVRGQSSVIPASTGSVLSCTIDGVEGESDVVSAGNLMSWKLCGASRLSEGRHQVVVNVTSGSNTIFWLDEITYFSLSPPNLKQKWSKLYPNTAEYSFTGISWRNPFDDVGNNGRESYANGAKATIPFYGPLLYLLFGPLLTKP